MRPLVIAHRGASGYLPEHTLAAKALAHGMGADYVEQDVVLTRDDHAVVLHDIHLEAVTDVAEAFPERARPDGRFYVIDFDLAEIRRLHVTERRDPETGEAVYPGRFPGSRSTFRIPTLAEEIELIQGLNVSTGRSVGVYPEIKAPAWHRGQGKDISRIVLETLARYGYREKGDLAYVQCFDPQEAARLRRELGCRLKLVQLIGDDSGRESGADYVAMRTPAGLQRVAAYADGIGPWLPHVVEGRDEDGHWRITSLVRDAHALGLEVHPYTLRQDALPDYVADFEALLRVFLVDVGVDGVFTDFPDRARRARDALCAPRREPPRRR